MLFYSANARFGWFLIMVTLAAPDMGLLGIAGVTFAAALAWVLGFDRHQLRNGYLLFNPLLASLTVGQRVLKSPLGPLFARLNNQRTFAAQIRRILARPVSDDEISGMWELLAREDGAAVLPAIIDYTRQRTRHARRWNGALERLDRPAMVAWGKKDPVAVFPIAERLAKEIPGARLETWDDLGHYPQVEDPERVARTLESFFGEVELRKVTARRA